MTKRHARLTGLVIAGGIATILVVPAFAASSPTEKLVNFKIVGPSTAKAGKVTFRVANASAIGHELVVIRTATKASKIPTKNGRASEAGSLGEVELKPGPHARAGSLRAALQRGARLLAGHAQGLHGQLARIVQ